MVKLIGLFLFLPCLVTGQRLKSPAWLLSPAKTLQTYQQNVAQLRQQYPTTDSLPDLNFFLFGVGNRMKLIYRNGRLLNARTGNIEQQWDVQRELIVPSEYTVQLDLRPEDNRPGQLIQIREDETGVWILQTDKRPRLIRGTGSPIILPRFEHDPNGPVLRVLLQEVLVNVLDGTPLTNFLVYNQPHAEDALSIRAVLRATGNDFLITDKQISATDSTQKSALARKIEISNVDYPLSWERNAPGAHYPGLTVLEKTLVKQRLILSQAGYAAGLFLQLGGRQ